MGRALARIPNEIGNAVGRRMGDSELDAWFVREILPLEPILVRFLHRNWAEEAEVADLRQEAYVLVYEAAAKDFFEVVAEINNAFDCVAVFSHNPGITAFANELTKVKIDDMPACAIFALNAETKDWQSFHDWRDVRTGRDGLRPELRAFVRRRGW